MKPSLYLLRLISLTSTLLVSFAAQATPRIYLMTVDPGPGVQSAFGHAVIEVEQSMPDDLTEEQVASRRARNLMYDYGQPNLMALLTSGNLVPAIGALLNDTVPTQAQLTSRARFEQQYSAESQTWSRDELILTPEQALTLSTNLRTSFVSIRRSGGYPYSNFSDNCTTRIRDHIFAVVDPSLRANLEAQPSAPEDTYLTTVSGLMDQAATAHGGTLSMVPSQLRGTPMEGFVAQGFSDLGIRSSVTGGADFLMLLGTMHESLSNDDSGLSLMADSLPASADGTEARQALMVSFANFESALTETPPNAYLAIYTPGRLKAKLQELGLIAAPLTTPQP